MTKMRLHSRHTFTRTASTPVTSTMPKGIFYANIRVTDWYLKESV
jgi:hypothetical protein